MGQLGQFEGMEWSEARTKIDQIHRGIAERDGAVGFVSAEGLETKADRVHFNSAALDEFGRRYAAALEVIAVASD